MSVNENDGIDFNRKINGTFDKQQYAALASSLVGAKAATDVRLQGNAMFNFSNAAAARLLLPTNHVATSSAGKQSYFPYKCFGAITQVCFICTITEFVAKLLPAMTILNRIAI